MKLAEYGSRGLYGSNNFSLKRMGFFFCLHGNSSINDRVEVALHDGNHVLGREW